MKQTEGTNLQKKKESGKQRHRKAQIQGSWGKEKLRYKDTVEQIHRNSHAKRKKKKDRELWKQIDTHAKGDRQQRRDEDKEKNQK